MRTAAVLEAATQLVQARISLSNGSCRILERRGRTAGGTGCARSLSTTECRNTQAPFGRTGGGLRECPRIIIPAVTRSRCRLRCSVPSRSRSVSALSFGKVAGRSVRLRVERFVGRVSLLLCFGVSRRVGSGAAGFALTMLHRTRAAKLLLGHARRGADSDPTGQSSRASPGPWTPAGPQA